MASDPTFGSDIQASTFNDYIADVAFDNFGVETAWQQHMRALGAFDPFTGGKLMEEPFIMNYPTASSANPGTNFEIEHVQQLAALVFPPRLYTARDMYETFSLQVQNKGPNARIILKDMYYANAVASISINLEVDGYWHGQAAISGQVANDRTTAVNGMAEALSDGKNNSWQGDYFVYYGSQVRNGAIQSSNNSVPVFFGNSDGTAAQISVRALINFLVRQRKFCGGKSPEITVTTPNGWAYILSALQTQQQFTEAWDGKFEALPTVPDTKGISFLGTVIYDDILTPGAAWGEDFPTSYINTSNLTSTFTSSSTATGTNSPSNLPASTTITVGETIFALTGRAWKYRPSDDQDFLFGTRENQVYNNNTNDAMLMNLAINMYTMSPKMSGQGYGFSS